MNSIHRTRIPSTEEQLRIDLLEWREITLAHSKTEEVPAPIPKYEVLYFLEDGFLVEDDVANENILKPQEELIETPSA